jgi:hypothetical protein
MALKAELEELLATIEDQKVRDEQRKFLEGHPQFQEAALRQSDYDRKMNEVKTERQKEQEALQAARERAEKWQKWSDENVPRHTQLMDEYKKIQKKNEELQEAVEAAKAAAAAAGGGGGGGTGGEVDEAKLLAKVEAEVAKRGYVSRDEVMKIATEEAGKLAKAERDSFFKDTLPNVLEWNQKMMDFNWEHRQEFNEQFDRKAFSKFVSENKLEDLDKAYGMFVNEKRTEKKIATETEKRVKDELSKRNFPGSGATPSSPDLGPVQLRRAGKDGLPPEATISEAAMAAAAEMRQEGKF